MRPLRLSVQLLPAGQRGFAVRLGSATLGRLAVYTRKSASAGEGGGEGGVRMDRDPVPRVVVLLSVSVLRKFIFIVDNGLASAPPASP